MTCCTVVGVMDVVEWEDRSPTLHDIIQCGNIWVLDRVPQLGGVTRNQHLMKSLVLGMIDQPAPGSHVLLWECVALYQHFLLLTTRTVIDAAE